MTSLRVLVVDDDAVLCMVLAEMLDEMGLHVCGIETTQSGAIAAALRLKPDLIIVDSALRPGSGAAVMAAIELHGRVAHVFMSGAPLVANPSSAPVLLKPFGEDALLAAIGRATAAHPHPPESLVSRFRS
jgi:CheY-like chemotaxis protein